MIHLHNTNGVDSKMSVLDEKHSSRLQCFGSGLDTDSTGSADPDPDWESGYGSRQFETGPPKREKLINFMYKSLSVFLGGRHKVHDGLGRPKKFTNLNFY
jgi:hypothetical protein